MQDSSVTESWREKNYEEVYTEKFFKVFDVLVQANTISTLQNTRNTFAAVKGIAYALIYSDKIMKTFEFKTKPVLKSIEIILYADHESKESMMAQKAMNVKVMKDPRTKQMKIENMQNILNQLWEVYYLTKQWAYEMGFFAKKPFGRKYGKDAIQDVMDM